MKLGRDSRSWIAMGATCLAAACGGAVATSDPISFEVGTLKTGEMHGPDYIVQRSIDREPGKPFDLFLWDARWALDGSEPGSIDVDSARIDLGDEGFGAAGLGAVLGSAEVFLLVGGTELSLGTLDAVPGGTVARVPFSASPESFGPFEPDLVDGSFRVGLRGRLADVLPERFEVRPRVVLTFRAFH